jgi:hypothetical protein
MSINTYIRLGLGALIVCMCLQSILFCGSEISVAKNGTSIRTIQADLEASEINDAA